MRWKIRRSLKWKRERAHLKMPKYLYICVVYDVIMIFSITNKKNKKQKKYLVELLQNLLSNYKSPTMIMILSRRLFDYIKRFFFLFETYFYLLYFFNLYSDYYTLYLWNCAKLWAWSILFIFLCKNMILRRHKRVLKKE